MAQMTSVGKLPLAASSYSAQVAHRSRNAESIRLDGPSKVRQGQFRRLPLGNLEPFGLKHIGDVGHERDAVVGREFIGA